MWRLKHRTIALKMGLLVGFYGSFALGMVQSCAHKLREADDRQGAVIQRRDLAATYMRQATLALQPTATTIVDRDENRSTISNVKSRIAFSDLMQKAEAVNPAFASTIRFMRRRGIAYLDQVCPDQTSIADNFDASINIKPTKHTGRCSGTIVAIRKSLEIGIQGAEASAKLQDDLTSATDPVDVMIFILEISALLVLSTGSYCGASALMSSGHAAESYSAGIGYAKSIAVGAHQTPT